MTFDEPIPFQEAIDKLMRSDNLPTELSTAEMRAHTSAQIRDGSFFSARVTNAHLLQDFKDGVESILRGKSNFADQRSQLKDWLAVYEYRPERGKQGTLQDLSSNSRLMVMLKTNVALRRGFGQWQEGNREGALEAFPAQELLPSFAKTPREDWPQRWKAALEDCGQPEGATNGTEAGGRLVALKNHPIWESLGDGAGGYDDALGNPYPPFAFGSERELEDVDYEETVGLGLMDPDDDPLQPKPRRMNDGLAASIDDLDDDIAQALMEGISSAVELVDGVLRFKNDARPTLRDRGEAVLNFLREATR